MLDQEVDPFVLQRVAAPENLASHMFALLHNRPEFDSSHNRTPDAGQPRPSGRRKVTWVRTIVRGPDAKCGYLVQTDFPVRMPLDGPLLPSDWTAEINYLANSEGSMTMSPQRRTRNQGARASRAQPRLRTPAWRRRRHQRAREHRGAIRMHRVGPSGVPGAAVMPSPGKRSEPPGGIEPPTYSLRVNRSTD